MNRQKELQELREQLVARRRDLLEVRSHLRDAWDALREPEPEFEETAQKSAMWQGMEHLDKQGRDEIEAIDRSLSRIDAGTYGFCDRCKRNIEIKRLKALPSTNLCRQCATRQEMGAAGRDFELEDEEEETEETGSVFGDLSDEELMAAILDELESDGRIDIDDLEISCEDGVVYLEGSVGNAVQHRLLIEIVEERMALRDVVDNVKVEGRAVEPGEEEEAEPFGAEETEEVQIEEEPVEEDALDPDQGAGSMGPEDDLGPEKEE